VALLVFVYKEQALGRRPIESTLLFIARFHLEVVRRLPFILQNSTCSHMQVTSEMHTQSDFEYNVVDLMLSVMSYFTYVAAGPFGKYLNVRYVAE
jgi:hypothetical protein